MKIAINGTEYRILSDYEIKEQAGATAVMQATILLEDKRIPQPFDAVEIEDEGTEAGFDDFTGGVRDNTQVVDGDLQLSIDEDLDGTWYVFTGLAWEDIA